MKSLGVGAQICALSSLFVLSLSSCTSGSGSNDPPPPPPPPPELEGQGNFLQGVDDDGFQAANGTSVGGISDNGRWVVLTSADNLDTADQLGFATTKSEDSVSPKFDPGFTQGYLNVFVRDRDADGDNVLDETGLGETDNVLVSFPLDISPAIPGNGDSFDPQISADGRFVFFKSTATNLIPGDTNGIADIFVYDRDADEDGEFDTGLVQMQRVSLAVAFNGTEEELFANALYPDHTLGKYTISRDGRHVAFFSNSPNLQPRDKFGAYFEYSDPWGAAFIYDRDVEGDGLYGFEGGLTRTTIVNPVDFKTLLIEPADYDSLSLSYDGRYVAFAPMTPLLNLLDFGSHYSVYTLDRDSDGDGIFDDFFRYDLISRNYENGNGPTYDSAEPLGHCIEPSISSSGQHLAFRCVAENLVIGDVNGFDDVFVYNRDADGNGFYDFEFEDDVTKTTLISHSADELADGHSLSPVISGNGAFVYYQSEAGNLGTGVFNNPGLVGDFKQYRYDRDYDQDGKWDENGEDVFDDPWDVGTRTIWLEASLDFDPTDSNQLPVFATPNPLVATNESGFEGAYTTTFPNLDEDGNGTIPDARVRVLFDE